MRTLFALRWRHFVHRTVRKADNLRVYLHWQAVIIYLYAGATFLGGPIYYLLVPTLIPDPIRRTGGVLLTLLLGALLASALYRALFSAADGFPSPIPVADVQFVLTAPISPAAFLGDRFLWGLLQAAGQASLLTPLLWAIGRAFWSPWGWPEALAGGALYIAVQLATLATGLLLYGLPQSALRVLKGIRAGLWGVSVALGLIGLLFGRVPGPDSAAIPPPVPDLDSLALLPRASSIIAGLLPATLLWALLTIVLTLLVARPYSERLADDIVQADRRRVARMSGQADLSPRAPGLARISLTAWWGNGFWAVAWRQLASYRHLPLTAWPVRLLALLAVAGAPSFLQLLSATGAASVAGGLPLLIPILIAVTATAGLMGNWRHEVREGWGRRILPLRTADLVIGTALWPGLAVGLVATLGLPLRTGGDLVTTLSAVPLALVSGVLIALLAMHEEYLAEISVAGPMEGRQVGKTASLILGGTPVLLAYELLRGSTPAVTFLLLAVAVAAESYALARYLAFRLASDLE